MPCLQRHMNKQLLQKCFYFNKIQHNLICFLFSSYNFYSKMSFFATISWLILHLLEPLIYFSFMLHPMGHSFNPFLHQPLIPPLDQHTGMSCDFTDFHPSKINRFHLAGYTVILYLGTSHKKINKSITVA